MTTADTIKQRDSVHGNFADTARIAQLLKSVIDHELVNRQQRGQVKLSYVQREVIDLITTKIARIIAGDNNEPDHYHDIGGYALLAENEAKLAKIDRPFQPTAPVVNSTAKLLQEEMEKQKNG